MKRTTGTSKSGTGRQAAATSTGPARFYLLAAGDLYGDNPQGPYPHAQAAALAGPTDKLVTAQGLAQLRKLPRPLPPGQPTPGPWHLDRGQIRSIAGDALGSVPHSLGDETDRANGRLMAAAPDLLSACTMALEWLDNLCEGLGQTEVTHYLPNGTRGRLALREAIERATSTGNEI